jgi:hypothetical protein
MLRADRMCARVGMTLSNYVGVAEGFEWMVWFDGGGVDAMEVELDALGRDGVEGWRKEKVSEREGG